jgi:hypothetical protein
MRTSFLSNIQTLLTSVEAGVLTLCMIVAGGIKLPMVTTTPAQSNKSVNFLRDIEPIFQLSCISYHGPAKSDAGLRLDSEEAVLRFLWKCSKTRVCLEGGPGREPDGNFFLSQVEAELAPADRPEAVDRVGFSKARADESQRG